uniref:Uncharacterized protein n=1 Tax=Acrobeloides nanus TaxID=290746 RepID=A0A914ELP5_9BILA
MARRKLIRRGSYGPHSKISLMENDVQLLQKLLKLGETIQELRNSRPVHRASSETSLASSLGEDEENDDWRPLEQRDNFSASMSAITRLYVDDEPPNVQYFSRKNSVLRIPIPPRSSNRMLGNKRIPRRPSELAKSGRLHLEDSGHSSGFSSSDSPPQHSPNAISDSLSSRSTLSDRLPVFEEIKIPRVSAGHRVSLPVGTVLEKEHRYTKYSRHESSDSGIRDDGSKSPPLLH